MTTVPWIQAMDAAGAGVPALPDGTYDVKVISADGSKLTGNSKPMIVAKFQVQTGPHANRTVTNNFVVSLENPNAMSFFFQHMAIFGLDRNYFSQNPTTEQVAQAIVGRTCQIKTSTRNWNGRQLNNVDEILPSSGMQVLGTAPVTTGPTLAPVIPLPGQMQQPMPQQPQFTPQPMPQPAAANSIQPMPDPYVQQPPPQPAYQPPPQEQPQPAAAQFTPQQPQYQQPAYAAPVAPPQQPDPGFAQAQAMQPVQAPQMPVAPQQPQPQVPQPEPQQMPAQVPQQSQPAPVAPAQQFDANGQPVQQPQPLTAPPTVPF